MSYGIKGIGVDNKLGEPVTFVEINFEGIVINRSSGEKGIIPLEYLEEYNADNSDFRIGERFDAFPVIHKHKGGRREQQMMDGFPVYHVYKKPGEKERIVAEAEEFLLRVRPQC